MYSFAPPVSTRPKAHYRIRQHIAVDDELSSDNATDCWDWKEVASSVFEADQRPIILFDGHCNRCNGGVNVAIDHDPSGE